MFWRGTIWVVRRSDPWEKAPSPKSAPVHRFLEGGGFWKINWNFSRPFFRSTKLIFWALPNHYKSPILTKLTVPQAIFQKTGQPRNRIFSEGGPPLKLVYIAARGAFRKVLQPAIQNSAKGDPLGRQGIESLRGEAFPPPPKSANACT